MKTNRESESQNGGPSPVRIAAVVGLAVILIVGIGAFLWLKTPNAGPNPPPTPVVVVASSSVSPDAPTSGAAAVPAQGPESLLDRGRELSLIYCASCHLYPKPEILDRFTWAMETLPRMSYWLGLAENDLAGEPGIEELTQAGLLPTAPLLPMEDWRNICNYYIAAAPVAPVEIESRPPTEVDLKQFAPRAIVSQGGAHNAMIRIMPGERRLLLGNARSNTVDVINLQGSLLRRENVDSAPVDANRVGGGWLISLIGSLPPADDARGSIVFLSDGGGPVKPVLTALRRPVQSLIHDLDGDGDLDRVVSEYGNVAGEVFWEQNLGKGEFARFPLLEQPGAARSAIADFNGDSLPDIAVITAQARESVTLLMNDGKGGFPPTSVADYHPAWGNVHLEVADFNGDGRPDLLTVNGDSADYMIYPSARRAYHGVRILLNDGPGPGPNSEYTFREAFFFPMYGAYKAFARDFDGDGDLDIAACAYYPHYPTRPQDGFVYLENLGGWKFRASTCSEALAGRWIAMDAADADGDGDIDLALGSFLDGPGEVPEKLSQEWDRRGASVLYLENQLR